MVHSETEATLGPPVPADRRALLEAFVEAPGATAHLGRRARQAPRVTRETQALLSSAGEPPPPLTTDKSLRVPR